MTDNFRLSFLRFFRNGPKHEDPAQLRFRRTQSLCDGRAGVSMSQVDLQEKLSRNHRFSQRKLRKSPKTQSQPMGPMDLNHLHPANTTSSSTSSIPPLPVEVVQLCESAFGKLYSPYYAHVRWSLLEQMRRIFYGDCHGDLQALCHSFLAPAANLLDAVKRRTQEHFASQFWASSNLVNLPAGWPLCIEGKVLIHLTELDSDVLQRNGNGLRAGDFYVHISRSTTGGLFLCLKLRTLLGEVIQVRIPESQHSMAFSHKWFEETIFHSSDARLLGALQFCVVSFERSIERIDLQLLASGLRSPSNSLSASASHLQMDSESLAADFRECQCSCLSANTQLSTTATANHDHLDSGINDRCQIPTEKGHPSGYSSCPNSPTGNINRASLISELHEELLLSGAVTFPGVLDRQQHPVVSVFPHKFPIRVTEKDFVDLFGYYYSISRESIAKTGFTLLVDLSTPTPNSSVIPFNEFLRLLDGSVRKIEEKISSAIHRLLIIIQSETPIEMADQIRDSLVQSSSVKTIFVHGADDLRMQLDDMNILSELGGRLIFSHQRFISYRKEIEPFIETCRQASRRLLEAIQDLRLLDGCFCQSRRIEKNSRNSENGKAHKFTTLYYNTLIQGQKKMMQQIWEDRFLLQLQTEGDGMLLKFQKEQFSPEAKDSYDQAAVIYSEVHAAMVKLGRLADKRLTKLEKCYQLKRFEEDARQVLSWVCKEGEDVLSRFSVLDENLIELRQQRKEFDNFYFIAKHQIGKGSALLAEYQHFAPSEYPATTVDLCRAMKENLRKFSERLDDLNDRMDDAAHCYDLIENAIGWTLTTINFVSQFRLEPNPTLRFLNEQIGKMERYVEDHPILSRETFDEVEQIAVRLNIPKLCTQAKFARSRCQYAESLLISKQTAFLKAKFTLVPAPGPEDFNNRLPYGFGMSFRNTGMRQASIPEVPETDETTSSSEPPFIDADSVAGTESIPAGSESSNQDDQPLSDAIICRESDGVERRPKGNMKRSLTWQAGEGSVRSDRTKTAGSEDESSSDSRFNEDDFSQTDKARVNRRESWTVPTSNSHLICGLSKSGSNENFKGHFSNGFGNNAALIIQELVQTEQDYINALRFVIDNYLPEIFSDTVPQTLRGKRNIIFGNLSKVHEFHENEFSRVLSTCENSPFSLGQIFLRFDKQFSLYAIYTHNKPKSDELMTECGNEFFKAKQLALQDKMDLSSYLLRPVQRMGKYALLLKELLKVCPRTEPEWIDLQAAEEMVKFQLRHGNDLLAMDLLKDCDVNLKEQGRLIRQDDMLVWQAGKKKTIRRVFLFEEIILFSKIRRAKQGHDIYQYKSSLKTSDLGLTEQLGESPTKFEIWFRKRKSGDNFVLQASSPDAKLAWTKDISSILWNQAFKSREARMAEMSCMGIGNKSCQDIKPSEDQINHRFVNLRSLGCRFRDSISSSSSTSSLDHLRSHRHARPHSVISVSSNCSVGSTLISSPVPSGMCSHWTAPAASTPLQEDANESPRRSHCSSESGICTDMNNSGSPVDSDSSK